MAHAEKPAGYRPYRVDDFFSLERLGAVEFAPDSDYIAFMRKRAPASNPNHSGMLFPEVLSDVWLQEAPGRPARNLTNGHVDGSGWWGAKWSPNGARLAFLSSRGGNVTIWLWERDRNRLRQISSDGVDFARTLGFRWVDNQTILFVAMPEGQVSTPMGLGGSHGGRAVDAATAAWSKTARGELSHSVIKSTEFTFPERRLLLVDVTSGRSRIVGRTSADRSYGGRESLWLSPDRRVVVFLQPVPAEYALRYRTQLGTPAEIEIQRLDGRQLTLSKPLPKRVLTSTLQWSPDGRTLAFFAYDDAVINLSQLYGDEVAKDVVGERTTSRECQARLWTVDAERGTVEQLSTADLDLGQSLTPPRFLWLASGDLLFHASLLSERARPDHKKAPRWITLERAGTTREFVADAGSLPESLSPIEGSKAFVGLKDGELLRVDATSGAVTNLTAHEAEPVLRINGIVRRRDSDAVFLSIGRPSMAGEEARLRYGMSLGFTTDMTLDIRSGTAVRLNKPQDDALLVNRSLVSDAAVYRAHDRTGTWLWRVQPERPPEVVVHTNEFLNEITPLQQRVIEYRSLNGEPLKAVLTLPFGYQKGRRYPVVVWSDIGQTDKRMPHAFQAAPESVAPETIIGIDAVSFIAASYAWLRVSVPTVEGMDRIGRANLLMLTNGLIPALDKASELGYTDPDRAFIYGESSWGYGVFGVVTQTARFKAAVAEAGFVNLFTDALSVSPAERYSAFPFDATEMGARYHDSELPVWRNAMLYGRNSPINYVDRVQTPLMIVHGDLDLVPIEGPEQFFAALVLQRKPAQFIRYWGEGHGLTTPANLRDKIQRMLAWFDEHGDIARNDKCEIVFKDDRPSSRNAAPAWSPSAFAKCGPGASMPRGGTRSNLQP